VRPRAAGIVLILCGALTACGDRIPAAPGPPEAIGFLHVLQQPLVITYEIDATGHLRSPVTQTISTQLSALAGEPQGRFVYAARGGWSSWQSAVDGSGPAVVSYAPDPRNGTPSQVSEIALGLQPAYSCPLCADAGKWVWLRGGPHRVHGVWRHAWSTGRKPHRTHTYVAVAVAGDGQLGPVSQTMIGHDEDPGEVVVDVRADVLYEAGNIYFPEPDDPQGGIQAYAIEADGSLKRVGWSDRCLDTTMCEFCYASPLVTARGFLFASRNDYHSPPTVCSYQGLKLKPLNALDLAASAAEAFVPPTEAKPALLAMNATIDGGGVKREELRVFAMSNEGDLRMVYGEELPDRITQLQFHPSGRFLYAVDAASRLRAYAVGGDGRLSLFMSGDHAGGSMAITLKDVGAADR